MEAPVVRRQSTRDESRPGGAGDLLRRFWPFLAVAIFAGALAVLHRELAAYRFADIRHSLRAVSPGALANSVLITGLASRPARPDRAHGAARPG